jgi:chemotaxis signal transduction protein
MQNDSFEKWIGILVFTTSSIEFGCNIARVHILTSANQKLTSEGSFIYNNVEIPLYYLGDILKVKGNSKNKNSRILIFESSEGIFGVGIDKIKEVLPLNEQIFANEVKVEGVTDNKLLVGKIHFEGRTIVLPDFDEMFCRIKNLQNVT